MSWYTSDRHDRLPPNWDDLRVQVMRRDGGKCKIRLDDGCEVEATDVDHINPGDDHSLSNLRAACGYCHVRKSAREGNAAKARMRAKAKRPKPRHPGSRR
jgi:5-methylcytosine-specific restriction protein A